MLEVTNESELGKGSVKKRRSKRSVIVSSVPESVVEPVLNDADVSSEGVVVKKKSRFGLGLMIGLFFVIACMVLMLGASSEPIGLTAEKIESLKVASNTGNDHFIGSRSEQGAIVDAFVADNSASDPTHLYIAANTATLLDRKQDAMFLFYAAQIRKALDYQRFGLGEADGNNVQTYWGYLNQGGGMEINTGISDNREAFSKAIRQIEKWNAVPADNAYYPEEMYGTPKVSKDKWESVAKENKDSFFNEFAYKYEKIFNDPELLEALLFTRDYNYKKIPYNEVNSKKYEEYSKLLKPIFDLEINK